jgi:GGDEF domain-containing protein
VATMQRWFWCGTESPLLAAVAAVLGPPAGVGASRAGRGDAVVLPADATTATCADLPTGHAFGAVRALKDRGVAVFVVVATADRIGVQLARFVLADGVAYWDAAARRLDADEWTGGARPGRRVATDELLRRLEAEAAMSTRGESNLQRLLRFESEDTLLHRLQDPETGLFDGPYATLKLDEEWKRAHRFHQPLSLLLLDLGVASTRGSDAERRGLLAEASGVFLNECRDIDVLARFAPTIFLFLLPGTGPDGASVLANRILTALQQRLQAGAGSLRPACGIASVPSSEIPDRRTFLAVAEACLRRAVATGSGGLCTSWQ